MIKNDDLKGLVFVPTYNEKDNVEILINELDKLELGFDYLFIDDNSPDGTGSLLDDLAAKRAYMHVIHRPAKMGIGSAHVDGIEWAYENQYQLLVTMDSDFSHTPAYILRLLALRDKADVVLASRYMQSNSLSEWNLLRKFLTNLGHLSTRVFLGMSYDATGAFRLYRLDHIPPACFHAERSLGYSFFFESLFVLYKNGFKIAEVAIDLPARTYGRSKMKFRDVVYSVTLLVNLIILNTFKPGIFRIDPKNNSLPQKKTNL